MRPYGWKRLMWRDEDYGPTSKHTGGTTRDRHRYRQLLHRLGRQQGKSEIKSQLDAEDSICPDNNTKQL